MQYSIREVSEMTGIPASTLRYYDREGLLPFLRRTRSGYRSFGEVDLATLQVVECLKDTGMSIEDMRRFSRWAREGDSTLHERRQMFLERREAVKAQIERMRKMLAIIEHKCEYYRLAEEAGTESHLQGKVEIPYSEEFRSGGIR